MQGIVSQWPRESWNLDAVLKFINYQTRENKDRQTDRQTPVWAIERSVPSLPFQRVVPIKHGRVSKGFHQYKMTEPLKKPTKQFYLFYNRNESAYSMTTEAHVYMKPMKNTTHSLPKRRKIL